MKKTRHHFALLLLSLCILSFLVVPGTAVYTTEVTVRRLSTDGLTPINETTLTYQQMEATLPVQGDGSTYYYFQGPIFPNEWNDTYAGRYVYQGGEWNKSQEKWDRVWNTTLGAYVQMEECNVLGKNLGKLKGTDVRDLCNLLGGLPSGRKVRVTAVDNFYKELPYSAIYTPTAGLGPYVITWWSVDAGESGLTSGYTGPDYPTGMRATFFGDTSRNPWGKHVSGLGDMYEGLPPSNYYYYVSGGIFYPSGGGYTIKNVRWIDMFTTEAQPAPVADFSAQIKTDRIVNGGFETLPFPSGWTAMGDVTSTTTKESGTYGAKLVGRLNQPANISQQVDLTGVSTLRFWRKVFSGQERYFEVLIDGEGVAYVNDAGGTATVDVIDVSGYTGTHTLTFQAVCTFDQAGSITTAYLDNIDALTSGTSGPAPLTIQFADLSTKMENPSGRSWAWDFDNNGTTDSTVRNPSYTYSSPGTYTVKLTATNAAGSDVETKTNYITVGSVPVANFYGRVNTTANGGFETGTLSGWTSTGSASVQTTQKHTGTYAASLAADNTNDQSFLEQSVNLSSVSQLSYSYHIPASTTGNLKVKIDGAEKKSYTGSTSIWTQDTVDTSSYSGPHTIRFEVNRGGSNPRDITAYLDDIVTMSQPVGSITGTAPLTVYFTDTSTNTPTSWSWTFGDGGTSADRNPVHTYTGTSSYTVGLTATNAAGSDSETKAAYVVTYTTPTISIDTTGGISGWDLVPGDNENTSSVNLSVTTTASTWHVSVKDAKDGGKPAGTEGKMAEYADPAYVTGGEFLTNAIQVKSGTRSYVTLSGTDQEVQSGTSSGDYDIGLKQVIAAGDPALTASHVYRIVITFTGYAD